MTAGDPPGSRLRDHPAFCWLVLARWTDTVGNAVAPIAVAFAVLDLTGSTTDVGLVVGARSAAMVVFVLLGGVAADRLGRSAVLVWSNVVAAVGQAIVALLVLTGQASIPWLVVLSTVHGAAGAMSLPASSALVPATVPRSLLQRANAVNSAGISTVSLLGLVGGAALVALIGPGWGLAADAASFLITAVLFARLWALQRVRGQTRAAPTMVGSALADLRQGWTTFSSTGWLWTVVLGFMVVNALMTGAITVLGPVVADATFGRARWGWVLAAEAAGALVGTMLLSRRTTSTRLPTAMVAAAFLAPWLVALGTTASVAALIVIGFVAGIGVGVFEVGWDLSMQGHLPERQLSRVYAFDQLGSFLAMPLGQIAAGPLAALAGTSQTLVGFGVVAGLTCLLVAALPAVRRLPAVRLAD